MAFEPYPSCPPPVPVLCDAAGWDSITKRLGGAAGPDSVDAALAKCILTGYGRASAQLCEEFVERAQWLANESPPWTAYRAMTVRQLLGLDKEPGTRSVGIGCIWLWGICKLLLAETADEAKSACKATQLCAGLEAGIEGDIACVLALPVLSSACPSAMRRCGMGQHYKEVGRSGGAGQRRCGAGEEHLDGIWKGIGTIVRRVGRVGTVAR